MPLIAFTQGFGGSYELVPTVIVKLCVPPRPSETLTV